jgi:hypothetical protein
MSFTLKRNSCAFTQVRVGTSAASANSKIDVSLLEGDAADLEFKATETEHVVVEKSPTGQALKVEVARDSPSGDRTGGSTTSSHLTALATRRHAEPPITDAAIKNMMIVRPLMPPVYGRLRPVSCDFCKASVTPAKRGYR